LMWDGRNFRVVVGILVELGKNRDLTKGYDHRSPLRPLTSSPDRFNLWDQIKTTQVLHENKILINSLFIPGYI